MADNGRPFPHSKTRLNNQGVKTPFIVSFPKLISQNDKYSTSLISAIDIAPTVLDLANIGIPESFQGVSFLEILKNPKKEIQKLCFC